MAIRFPTQHAAAWLGGLRGPLAAAVSSGWRAVVLAPGTIEGQIYGMTLFQPSRLSRPANLGTAYSGVWTANIKNTF